MTITRIVTGVITDGTITSADMAVDPRNASNLNSGDVPLAQLDNVQTVDLNPINSDIAILAFKTQANGNLARYNLVDQSVDAFEDASGVNAGVSTGEIRNAAGKYYRGGTAGTVTGGQSFTNKVPTVITDTTKVTGGTPKTSVGAIGDYVTVATTTIIEPSPFFLLDFGGALNSTFKVSFNSSPTGTPSILNLFLSP